MANARLKLIASGLTSPIGVAFKDGALYVSAINRILRFDDIEEKLDQPGKPAVVTDIYPSEKHHGGKFIAFGPGWPAVCGSGGALQYMRACRNAFALISRIKPDGTGYEVYAKACGIQ